MAVTLFNDAKVGFLKAPNGGSGCNIFGKVTCDSVTRSGNTVTFTNVKVHCWTRDFWGLSYFDVPSSWSSYSQLWINGTANTSGSWGYGGHYVNGSTIRDWGLGNLTRSVSDAQTTVGVNFFFDTSDGRQSPDQTASIPARYIINVDVMAGSTEKTDGSVGTFNMYINDKLVSSNTSDYCAYNDNGTKWSVGGVSEKSDSWYYTGNATYSGTVNGSNVNPKLPFSAVVAPTAKAPSVTGRTWNSIAVSVSGVSFGAPNNRGNHFVLGICTSSGSISCPKSEGDLGNVTSGSTNIGNGAGSSDCPSNCKLAGCAGPFYAYNFLWNSKKAAVAFNTTAIYLPPHPLASLTQTHTDDGATLTSKYTFTWKGAAADGTNNISGARVNNQYRYYNGASWSNWTNVNTNVVPDASASVTVTLPFSKSCKFQARQVTYAQASNLSEVKELSFNTPSTATLSVNGNGVTFDVKVGSTVVKTGVSSYSGSHIIGSSYTVQNIKPVVGYYYTGGNKTGTVGGSGTSVTVSATGKTYKFDVQNGSITGKGTFDLKISGNSTYTGTGLEDAGFNNSAVDTGAALTSFSQGIRAGSSYVVNNIKETSSEWYYTGASQFTGTVTKDMWAETAIDLPFLATSVPTGLKATVTGRTYNSISVKVDISGYGAPANRAGRYIEAGILPSSATNYTTSGSYGYTDTDGRYAFLSSSETTSATIKLTPSNVDSHSNNKIAGCLAFKVGACADNKKKSAQKVESTVYYLPPAPVTLANIDKVEETGATLQRKFTISVRGGASDNTHNVTGAKVNNQYRYTENGTTWSDWTNGGSTSVDPGTKSTFSFTHTFKSSGTYNFQIQVRQVNSKDTSQATAGVSCTTAVSIGNIYFGIQPRKLTLSGQTKQKTLSGKNLLNPSNTKTHNGITSKLLADGTLQITGKATTNYAEITSSATLGGVSSGKTYTISATYTDTNTSITYNVNLYGNMTGDAFVNIKNGAVSGKTYSTTVTATNDSPACRIVFGGLTGETLNGILKFQLELGSTATSFEPYCGGTSSPNPDYPQKVQTVTGECSVKVSGANGQSQSFPLSLGFLELCKIGDYEDSIFEKDGKWYKKAMVGKAVLDGTEDWRKSGSAANNNFYYAKTLNGNTNKFGDADISTFCPYGGRIVPLMFTEYFTPRSFTDVVDKDTVGTVLNQGNKGYEQNYELRIGFGLSSSVNSADAAKTWLKSHNLTVYYVKTPTTTEITDATLVAQLNALRKAVRLNNAAVVTGASGAVLQPIVNVSDDTSSTGVSVSIRKLYIGDKDGKARLIKKLYLPVSGVSVKV